MKMKFLTIAMVSLLVTGYVNAQTRFGVKGGFNLAGMTYNSSGNVDNKNSLPTFHAGLAADFPITEMFSVKSGLELQSKGLKYENTISGVHYKQTSNPLYLELPVNFAVNFPLGDKTKLYVGGGPYAAVGIAGKNKWEYSSGAGTAKGSSTIQWGNDNPAAGDPGSNGQYKRFDAGANVIGGLDFGKFAIHTQYGLGLINTYPGSSNSGSDRNNRHRVFGVGGILYF